MTKLEEKLAELGYEPPVIDMFHKYFTKFIDDNWILAIETDRDVTKAIEGWIELREDIYAQKQIDELQQVFNQLQKDLEVLRNE